MKKVLFIDRDGTIIVEPPTDFQVDSFEKLAFLPHAIKNLNFIANNLDFELAMVTNQDGLGTECFPEKTFIGPHNLMMNILEGEDIIFDEVFIDKSFAEDDLPTRKPGVGMLTKYFSDQYDLKGSFVVGDRITDIMLAKNLGCKGILIKEPEEGIKLLEENGLREYCALISNDWGRISEFLFAGERKSRVERKTNETDILIEIDIDGTGKAEIATGLGFFDHMLEQIARHSGIDLKIITKGDLHVDEHHTIEDTGLALGDALLKAIGSKRGIERYGFCLPMDESLCSVALDFGGRPWLIWDADFKREKIGDMPTEMFYHFFKSVSDTALMNLNIKADGDNEHHKIEGIFKAFAKSIKMAIKRDIYKFQLPSSKGCL